MHKVVAECTWIGEKTPKGPTSCWLCGFSTMYDTDPHSKSVSAVRYYCGEDQHSGMFVGGYLYVGAQKYATRRSICGTKAKLTLISQQSVRTHQATLLSHERRQLVRAPTVISSACRLASAHSPPPRHVLLTGKTESVTSCTVV